DLDGLHHGGAAEIDAPLESEGSEAGEARVGDEIIRDGGVDVSADTTQSCPSGRGPAMVLAKSLSGQTWCIDSTEGTQAQYAAFLADKAGDVSGQSAECQWNTSYVPLSACSRFPSFDPVARKNKPVSGVDWCDALAFCKWAGKRLCGAIGDGGSVGD